MDEHQKIVLDYAAGGVTLATVVGYLPAIAAALTSVYMLVRLWESPTGRRLLRAVCERCAAWWDRRS